MASFGGTRFGNASFGGSGFLNAGIGSGVSLFPNLLGSLFNIGSTFFGGPGVLAANALSLAVRLFVSGIEAGGAGQGDFSGGDAGPRQAGLGGSFALQGGPIGAACGAGPSPMAEGSAWGGYCGPYAYQPFGSGSISTGYFSAPR